MFHFFLSSNVESSRQLETSFVFFEVLCAEHVLDVKVVKVRYSKNQIIKMKELLPCQLRCREARWEGRLWETLRADGQESHKRPTWTGELAPHCEADWFIHKCGGCAVEHRVLTSGGLLSCVVWLKSVTKDNAARAVMCALNIEESAESIVVVEPRAMSKSAGRRTWRTRIR